MAKKSAAAKQAPPTLTNAAGSAVAVAESDAYLDQILAHGRDEPPLPLAPSAESFEANRIARIHRSKLSFAGYNPRTIDKSAFAKLKKSVKQFSTITRGDKRPDGTAGPSHVEHASPPTVNARDGRFRVVGGHQRIRATDEVLKSTDYTLTIVLVDLDDAAERALNLALNNQSLQGQFDIGLLEQVLLEIPADQLDQTGFGKQDLQLLLSEEGLSTIFGTDSEIAQQALAESSIVDTLASIRESSREFEAKNGEHKNDEHEPIEDGAEGDQPSQESPAGSDDHGDSAADQLAGDSESEQVRLSPEQLRESDPEAYRQLLIDRRNAYRARAADADDAQFYVSFVFDGAAQLDRVLSAMKLDVNSRYQPGAALAELVGVSFDSEDGA